MSAERPGDSLPPSYFADVYRASDDPWDFETSPYEAAKYDATLAALPRERYRSGLEIGCSIGVLTARLADRCGALLAVDVNDTALARAGERCRSTRSVRFARLQVPEQYPDESFDLTVVSEVGYYWSADDLERARRLIVDHLEPGGHLLLAHWTPVVPDYPLTGDEVHEAFLAGAASGAGLRHLGGRRDERYRLDLFERTPVERIPVERA